MDRKLIHHSSEKISFLQIIGFIVILATLLYLFILQLFNSTLKAEVVAIAFFIIMLGIIFVFPDMMKDANKELSTMRIVVFMIINVFCILSIKIGWDAKNFKDIGVDQYWMGIVAFTFGAKATQSYFESKLAAVNTQAASSAITSVANAAQHEVIAVDILDSCGGAPGKPTEDAELPESKGGMI